MAWPRAAQLRIYRTYGQEAIAVIQANPYRLADEVRGIGFKSADELAARLGTDPRSPHRARAAVRYALHELAGQGHCGHPQTGVIQTTTRLVAIDPQLVAEAVQSVVDEGNVVREMVDGDPWLYLASLYRAEEGLAQSVQRILATTPHPLPPIDLSKAIAWVEQRLDIRLAASQQQAVRDACRQKLLVITGGPGVGKTTLVRSVLEIFSAKGLTCVLAAPTGRAAKRLSETTLRPAKTLHRLLEFDPATGDFRRSPQYPLAGDLFVLDETSMVDSVLGHQFLRRYPAMPASYWSATWTNCPRWAPARCSGI